MKTEDVYKAVSHGLESFKRQYKKLEKQHKGTLEVLREIKTIGPTKGDLFRSIPKSLQKKINKVLKNGN